MIPNPANGAMYHVTDTVLDHGKKPYPAVFETRPPRGLQTRDWIVLLNVRNKAWFQLKKLMKPYSFTI